MFIKSFLFRFQPRRKKVKVRTRKKLALLKRGRPLLILAPGRPRQSVLCHFIASLWFSQPILANTLLSPLEPQPAFVYFLSRIQPLSETNNWIPLTPKGNRRKKTALYVRTPVFAISIKGKYSSTQQLEDKDLKKNINHPQVWAGPLTSMCALIMTLNFLLFQDSNSGVSTGASWSASSSWSSCSSSSPLGPRPTRRASSTLPRSSRPLSPSCSKRSLSLTGRNRFLIFAVKLV